MIENLGIQRQVLERVIDGMAPDQRQKVTRYADELRAWFLTSGGYRDPLAVAAFTLVGLEMQAHHPVKP